MLKPLMVAALLLAGPTGPRTGDQGDSGEILRAVIAHEAKLYGHIPGDVQPCVASTITKTTFDGLRGRSDPQKQAEMAGGRVPLAETSDSYPWYTVVRGRTVIVEKQLQGRLGSAVRNIVARPPQPSATRIMPSWLTAPYRICEQADSHPRLEIAAPAVDGEFAFVGVDFECVLCGHGTTYVLQRIGAHWKIIAEWNSWVS